MSPRDHYRRALDAGTLAHDPAQATAIESFDDLYHRLLADGDRRDGLRTRVARALGRHPAPVRGLYVHGGVGTGKTHLFDLFFDALPFEDKLRLHFHRFMYLVHEQLRGVGEISSPLEQVAAHFAARARVLCLDEMHVNDITDAMLMHGLLRGLFRRGVTLVTTSNLHPDELYADGLQRERFLPAIDLLHRHTEVLALDGDTDWRLRNMAEAEVWHVPHDREADVRLVATFEHAVAVNRRKRDWITINGRRITVVYWADGVAWFDFRSLCRSARSSSDYLEIARFFHTVLLRRVPVMDATEDDAARRFVNLIDTLYDRNVRLYASAEAAPEEIYTGRRLRFEFQRTASRLREMQTREYRHQPHRA
ncbi:MAG: cell division protein ZapE [Halofilum sp. (in: g-proteobacteria)]|nr:cell division protein ZapE [Halofilum sp. (in: g-proteobacteria)]